MSPGIDFRRALESRVTWIRHCFFQPGQLSRPRRMIFCGGQGGGQVTYSIWATASIRRATLNIWRG